MKKGLTKPPTYDIIIIVKERKETKMKCSDNCGYWWADGDDRFPSCHYPYNDGYAPCEVDDEESEEEENE